MKKYLFVLLLTTSFPVGGEIIAFRLSPVGTDAAVGLSPMNAVPPAVGSEAFAQELSGTPLYFDTDLSTLSFGFVYVELSGRPTSVAIHGPAPAGSNAGQLIDLAPYHLPLFPGAGFVLGNLQYPTSAVPDLLRGLHCINLASPAFPMGELRGQLIPAIPLNGAPTVICPETVLAECGESSTVTVEVSDPDGDPLVVVWDWNGWPIQTNWVSAFNVPVTVPLTAEFPEEGTLSARAIDPEGEEAACSTLVSVMDTTPPVIESAVASRTVLWPPNHKMIPVAIDAVVTDGCGSAVWGIVAVTSNEEVDGRGDGRTAGDWEILDDHTVLLRAERSGLGDGRVYTLQIQALDASDNLGNPFDVHVTVPH